MLNCKKCGVEFIPTKGLLNYCSLQCRNSRTFSEESKQKKRISNLGQVSWNKGKKRNWVTSICEYCGNEINHVKSKPKKYHSECWKRSSGGYRKGSGIGKSGWYKGYWCDSSYELAWVIYQFEHNRPFERNKEKFEYNWKGKNKKYIPDFIQKNKLIEIKGYVNEQTKVKLQLIPNLIILFRNDLDKEFEYVETKYGKDFIKLYEGNPYKELIGKCKLCGNPCKEKSIYCSRKCAGIGNNRNSKLKLI